MSLYCHAVGSFHYKMEKERWMFFCIVLVVTSVGLTLMQDQVGGVTNCKTHDIFMIYCLTYSLLHRDNRSATADVPVMWCAASSWSPEMALSRV